MIEDQKSTDCLLSAHPQRQVCDYAAKGGAPPSLLVERPLTQLAGSFQAMPTEYGVRTAHNGILRNPFWLGHTVGVGVGACRLTLTLTLTLDRMHALTEYQARRGVRVTIPVSKTPLGLTDSVEEWVALAGRKRLPRFSVLLQGTRPKTCGSAFQYRACCHTGYAIHPVIYCSPAVQDQGN